MYWKPTWQTTMARQSQITLDRALLFQIDVMDSVTVARPEESTPCEVVIEDKKAVKNAALSKGGWLPSCMLFLIQEFHLCLLLIVLASTQVPWEPGERVLCGRASDCENV